MLSAANMPEPRGLGFKPYLLASEPGSFTHLHYEVRCGLTQGRKYILEGPANEGQSGHQ